MGYQHTEQDCRVQVGFSAYLSGRMLADRTVEPLTLHIANGQLVGDISLLRRFLPDYASTMASKYGGVMGRYCIFNSKTSCIKSPFVLGNWQM